MKSGNLRSHSHVNSLSPHHSMLLHSTLHISFSNDSITEFFLMYANANQVLSAPDYAHHSLSRAPAAAIRPSLCTRSMSACIYI